MYIEKLAEEYLKTLKLNQEIDGFTLDDDYNIVSIKCAVRIKQEILMEPVASLFIYDNGIFIERWFAHTYEQVKATQAKVLDRKILKLQEQIDQIQNNKGKIFPVNYYMLRKYPYELKLK